MNHDFGAAWLLGCERQGNRCVIIRLDYPIRLPAEITVTNQASSQDQTSQSGSPAVFRAARALWYSDYDAATCPLLDAVTTPTDHFSVLPLHLLCCVMVIRPPRCNVISSPTTPVSNHSTAWSTVTHDALLYGLPPFIYQEPIIVI